MSRVAKPSRDAFDLFVVQVLTTGLTLPILAMYDLRFWPPGLDLRLDVLVSPAAGLGLAPLDGVVEAAARQQAGLAVLAGTALGLALLTLVRALRGQFERHRRIARWTLPIWLYVSVTGVVVYLICFI